MQNEQAKELLRDRKKPESPEEQAKIYVEIAVELGEQITSGDFIQATRELEEQIKKKTESAASNIVALEDDQVHDVAGGMYYLKNLPNFRALDADLVENKCACDFVDDSCWIRDACDYVNVVYFACDGKYN